MQKSSLPVGIKTLFKYFTELKTLDMDCPIQRASGQWNNLSASMLIHSMLADYIIPNLYFRKEQKDGTNFLSVLDGKQRLTTVFTFINDEWTLHPKTPNVVVDGVEYTLALKKFSELEEDLKSAILGYRFTTYQIENATDEEIEETFARLNAGTPLSKIQQARPKMGMEMADWCNELVSSAFFQKSLNMTLAQLRREDDFLMLITGMMLLDGRYEDGFLIKTSASAAECVRFSETIRNNYSEEKREDMEMLVEYLSTAFGGAEYKFLKKNNIPIVMYNAQIAIEHGISEEEFLNAVVEFYENDCTVAYEEASGSGNVKMVNVNVRLKELLGYIMKTYPQYFVDDDEIPASVIEEIEAKEEATEDDSKEEVTIKEEAENSEESTENPTPVEESLIEVENTEVVIDEKEIHHVAFYLKVGENEPDRSIVCEVACIDDEYLSDLGDKKLAEYSKTHGVEGIECVYEVVEGMTIEEIIEVFGGIQPLDLEASDEEE